jgi:hypothetical protein
MYIKSFCQAEIEEYKTGYQPTFAIIHIYHGKLYFLPGEPDHLAHYKFQPLNTGVFEDL